MEKPTISSGVPPLVSELEDLRRHYMKKYIGKNNTNNARKQTYHPKGDPSTSYPSSYIGGRVLHTGMCSASLVQREDRARGAREPLQRLWIRIPVLMIIA